MIIELSITPVGNSEDAADLIAKAVDIIDDSGLDYQLTAMGTLIEGDWDDVMAVAKRCHLEIMKEVPRVKTLIRIDDHKGRTQTIGKRVHEIEQILGRELSEAF